MKKAIKPGLNLVFLHAHKPLMEYQGEGRNVNEGVYHMGSFLYSHSGAERVRVRPSARSIRT
ncbi:hypothetical protein ACVGWK_21865, partial [Enterobacter sichuanensis]